MTSIPLKCGMQIENGLNGASIDKAVEILSGGGLVAFPTETVYGLGASALDPYAVAAIFEMKKRPVFDPLIIHIGEKGWLAEYVRSVPLAARKMIERFWPGPLTIILRKRKIIPDIVTAGLPTVAVRMPSHPVAMELIRRFGRPIAAPSANPFGYMSPTRARHVAAMFKDEPLLILDGGNCDVGIESTIVSVKGRAVYINRHGAVTVEELNRVAGPVREKAGGSVCEAPGELPYHYAPRKPLKIIRNFRQIETPRSALLAFKRPEEEPPCLHMKVLTETGDLKEAAARFFSSLIELDREDIDVIYAERIPEEGLGKAMMERLKKAAKKYDYITH